MWVHEALTEIRMKVCEHLIAPSRIGIGFERAKLRDASSTALTFLHELPILSIVSVPGLKRRCFCFVSCILVLKFCCLIVSFKVYFN